MWAKRGRMIDSARAVPNWLRLAASLGLVASCAWGCGPYCEGPDCGCEGDDECILSCEQDGCDLGCSQTSSSCGAICGDDCAFECSDTNHCSSFSGDGSDIYCHNVPSCAAECGAGCNYTAENVSEAHVTVGPESVVQCTNLALCEVDCLGSCEVTCRQTSRCEVSCDGASPGGSDGSFVCD